MSDNVGVIRNEFAMIEKHRDSRWSHWLFTAQQELYSVSGLRHHIASMLQKVLVSLSAALLLA